MQSRSGTLTASTVATISEGNDPADGFKNAQRVEVFNRDGAAEIWFTVNGNTPTVAGDDCYCSPAAVGGTTVDAVSDGPVVIKLISSGTPKYAVTVMP